jgi:hypothetical protein
MRGRSELTSFAKAMLSPAVTNNIDMSAGHLAEALLPEHLSRKHQQHLNKQQQTAAITHCSCITPLHDKSSD